MPTYTYHWTPRHSLASIAKSGLDPEYARGKLKVVWSCGESRIGWALSHVARHHETAPDDMVLLRVRIDGMPTKPSSWPAVTLVTRRIPVGRISVRPTMLAGRFVPLSRYR